MKLLKRDPNKKRLKTAVNNYRLKLRDARKKLLDAMRNYKQAVDAERAAHAERLRNR